MRSDPPPLLPIELKRRIHALALGEGFGVMRIAAPGAMPQAPHRLTAWLQAGYHGTMSWMEARADQRADPKTLWSEVRSILMLGFNYGPASDPLASLAWKDRGTISVYARNRDYHDIIKGRLKALAQGMVRIAGGDLKVFVDTAPVLEKTLAEAAGLGWQGKHTVLISRDYGNWLFLAAIYTTLDLPPDPPEADHCGSCTRCLSICPTNAFPQPFVLDSRRCISYLTIEHKGQIPEEFRRAIGNRIYGCDDCLAVCPWNKFAQAAGEAKLHARADLDAPLLTDLATLDDAAFRGKFAGSPIKRIGRDRFVRNVLVAIGNSAEKALLPVAENLRSDGSALVAEMAEWASKEIIKPAIVSKTT